VILLGIGITATLLFSNGAKSVATLAAELRSTDPHLRHDAARKLAKLGLAANQAVPELASALTDPDKRVRFHSAKALSEIGPDAQSAGPSIISALPTADADCRYYLVKTLSKLDLNSEHAPAVPALINALRDENSKTRYYAVKCLKDIGPAAGASASTLRTLASDPDAEVRDAAASALKKVTKKS